MELINLSTPYAKHMNRLSNRIFGEVTKHTTKRSMRVVQLFSEKPMHKRPEVVDYYPPHPKISALMRHLRNYGLFRDEHLDFNEEYQRLRELRGKPKWIPQPFKNKGKENNNNKSK